MPYFHDEKNRTVYAVPSEPMAHSRKVGGKHVGWTVWVTIEVTSADNYMATPNQWAKATSPVYTEHYDHRDNKDQAVGWFRSQHMLPSGREVTHEEYERLKAEYLAEARQNKAPR